MLDEELRAGLAEWVRPVASLPAPDIRVLRRRARRRGVRRAAAITAVTAAVAVGITVGASRSPAPGAGFPAVAPAAAGGPQTWPAAPGTWQPGTWQPAGSLPAPDASPAAAPYFVAISARGAAAVVTDAFTGQVSASVRPPRSGPGSASASASDSASASASDSASASAFAGVAAAGDDHTFVLAARETGAVGFYELRLRPDGREESLSPLFTLPTRTVPAFAVSPDASLLAYTTGTGIETVSLAAGTGRSWGLADGQISSLSWAGDTTLAFEWQVSSRSGVQPAGTGLRLLDIARSGSLLYASRLLIPYCLSAQVCIVAPLISPDGSTVIATRVALGAGVTTTVWKYSARTGHALAAVSPSASTPQGSQACDALWTDPSGQQAAVFCGHGFVTDGGRFTMADLHLPTGILGARGQIFAW